MDVRSLALVVLVFGAGTALAGFVGLKYGRHAFQSTVQSQKAAPPQWDVQPANSPAPVLDAAKSEPSSSTPASVVAAEPVQIREMASPPENKKNGDKGRLLSEAPQPIAETIVERPKTTGTNARQAPKCNIQACSTAYRSFDASDCTYLPANGSRRICRK